MNHWFREAQYGMMIHWGLYSLLAGEWKGKRIKRWRDDEGDDLYLTRVYRKI